jgi:hypothetical protein
MPAIYLISIDCAPDVVDNLTPRQAYHELAAVGQPNAGLVLAGGGA